MRSWLGSAGVAAVVLSLVVGCGSAPEEPKKGRGKGEKGDKAAAAEKAPEAPKVEIVGPAPALLIGQAHFSSGGAGPKPLPAKLVIFRTKGGQWAAEEIQDPDSNVFHKAVAFKDGILTIAGEKAMVKLWKKVDGAWKATTLYEKSWGGKFNRFRDLEIGDVTGDGKDDLVLATHDAGVIVIGQEKADGTFAFTEFDQRPDTFVHEIEIGDVDGDGKKEFYATPSERNKASGESQPGSVWRYDCDATTCKHSTVIDFKESHAKEILVTDTDGNGTPELYVVREGHTVLENGAKKRVEGVQILRMDKAGAAWKKTVVAQIDDDQTRFLVPGDVDGDGKLDLVAAAIETGLWQLKPKGDGSFEAAQIDRNSGGFEHATHVADLDGDGKLEIYVASDKQKELRVYSWTGSGWDKKVIAPVGPASESFITWNIQNATL
jgi:hypothetical protein